MNDARCSVRFTRRYPAAPSEVWAALTEPESLRRWLGEAEWAALGARARELEPERLLVLDWRAPGEEASLVRFELTADGDGTMLVLDHSLIEEQLGMAYTHRWTVSLDRLGRLR
ncbi:MAG: SRPBCC domain-containing protein [Actinobacteria bacterium]|nr:SRPBCC domain-containing protein [Actinomycetota bacterium]